jgi:hypothetical protein
MVTAPTARPVGRSTAILPLLPCLIFTQTIRSTIGSLAIPLGVCLRRSAHQLRALLFGISRQMDAERTIRVGAWSRVRLYKEERHLLIDALIVADYGFDGS